MNVTHSKSKTPAHSTPRAHKTARAVWYIDLAALAFGRASDARAVAEHARSIGLSPGPLHSPKDSRTARLDPVDRYSFDDDAPAAFRISLGPAWHRPNDLREVLAHAERRNATVYRIDIALDVIGHDAERARRVFFPSSSRRRLTVASDLLQVRVDQDRWHSFKRTSYVETLRSDVSAALYSTRPSKLDPDGPPVMHVEFRTQFDAVPNELRCSPTAISTLFDDDALMRYVVEFVAPKKTLSPSTARILDALQHAQSGISVPDLAQLAGVSESSAYRALRELHTDGTVQTVERGGGRGRAAVRRVGTLPARALCPEQ